MSPLDAALFAFRRREPRFVLTQLSIVYVVLSLVIGLAGFAATWPAIAGIADWYLDALRAISSGQDPEMPPTAPLATLVPVSVAFGIVAWIVLASFEAACLRWLVRNERGGGLFGLKFDADTWRVFAIYWIWIGLALACVAATAIVYVAMRALAGVHPIARVVVMIVAALAPLGLLALLLWGAVRLSPAAALSVARSRFSFFGAWAATRDKFWPLLGAFVIVCAAYLLASTVIGGVIRIPIDAAMTPVMRDALSGGDAASVFEQLKAAFLTPLMIAIVACYAIVARILSLVFYIAWYGVNARAVLAAAEPSAAPPS